jgi:hypothetical protein
MPPRPSRTINRLHFDDLDPKRFEDLCLAIVFQIRPWADLRHYGRSGGDGGVDILAKERVADGVERSWWIQCRRYSRAPKAVLQEAIDDALSQATESPDVLLVIVACDVSRTAHESFLRLASERGIKTPLLWTASVLEARLHGERRDLLFSYFGISEVAEARAREASITRDFNIKKRLRKELLAEPKTVNWEKARKHPPDMFEYSELIIHSVDDSSYPNVDENSPGISGWFKLEVWDFYHNGLECIVSVERGAMDADGHWEVLDHDQPFDATRLTEIRMFRVGRIPYRDIVECDVVGDEYYPFPHLYCRFANGGEPYEGFRFLLISDGEYWRLDPDRQLLLKNEKRDTRPREHLQKLGRRRKRGKR